VLTRIETLGNCEKVEITEEQFRSVVQPLSIYKCVEGWHCEVSLCASCGGGERCVSMRFAFPGWEEEPVDDAGFPDIGVTVP
jgi:hypothetical protein